MGNMLRPLALALAPVGLVAAACSSAPKRSVEGSAPLRPPPAGDAAPAERSVEAACATAVAQFEAEASLAARKARPEQVAQLSAVLAAHCRRWPPAVASCMAKTPAATAQDRCLDDLDPDERAALAADQLAALRVAPTCDEVLADVTPWIAYPGPVEGVDRTIVEHIYREPIAASCPTWSAAARSCIADDPTAPRRCLDDQPGIAATLDGELARRTALLEAAGAHEPRDRKIACAAVVAAHYGRAAWRGKLAGYTAAERKRFIRTSVEAMTTACQDERWTPLERACVVEAADENERWICIDAVRWAYPAWVALPVRPGAAKTGIDECDAYMVVADALFACDHLPAVTHQAVRDSIVFLAESWKRSPGRPAEELATMRDGCRETTSELVRAAAAAGCPLPAPQP